MPFYVLSIYSSDIEINRSLSVGLDSSIFKEIGGDWGDFHF